MAPVEIPEEEEDRSEDAVVLALVTDAVDIVVPDTVEERDELVVVDEDEEEEEEEEDVSTMPKVVLNASNPKWVPLTRINLKGPWVERIPESPNVTALHR